MLKSVWISTQGDITPDFGSFGSLEFELMQEGFEIRSALIQSLTPTYDKGIWDNFKNEILHKMKQEREGEKGTNLFISQEEITLQ